LSTFQSAVANTMYNLPRHSSDVRSRDANDTNASCDEVGQCDLSPWNSLESRSSTKATSSKSARITRARCLTNPARPASRLVRPPKVAPRLAASLWRMFTSSHHIGSVGGTTECRLATRTGYRVRILKSCVGITSNGPSGSRSPQHFCWACPQVCSSSLMSESRSLTRCPKNRGR
jgi:hypothetical protein